MRKSSNRREHNPREREHRTSSSTGTASSSAGLMGDSEGDAAGKLFIGGVSWQTTEAGLREHFGKYGELTDAALMRNKHTGQPRGFGFVQFKDSSSADRVMAENHVLDGRPVDVKKAVPRDKSGTDNDEDSSTTSSRNQDAPIASKKVDRNVGETVRTNTVQSVKAPVSAWKTVGGTPPGSVTSAVGVVTDSLPLKSLNINKSAINDREESTAQSSSQLERQSPRSTNIRPEQHRKIFVGGLAPSVTDSDFRQYFEQFGSISDAVVMFDRQTQRSRGFGFITFDNSESLDSVLDLDKHEMKGKVVEVKRAEPKEPVRASEDGSVESQTQEWNTQSMSHHDSRHDTFNHGAISLQETLPIPGAAAMGMVFGVQYQHIEDGRGYGMFVPGIPMDSSGHIVAVPMGCSVGVNSHPFAFAPMPPAYFASKGQALSFDYDRAWHAGDFSMDEDFNATGYGSFRGQAATHGRLRRKYRPY